MRIYSMTATFGKLEHQTLTLRPGLNIIEAPNEWGKSTWCAFLVNMLYGLDTKARTTAALLADKDRYAPWSGAAMAGRIDLCWNGRDITIERSSKGRIIFGNFRAYETATGLDVPELNGLNCGQQLLGVERSVFIRAGFLRQNDMTIAQDEALRRRLNNLVTTGEEGDDGDKLNDSLKDLKNKCRYNRSGLLPQAESDRDQLKTQLEDLHDLANRTQEIRTQQTQLEQIIHRLENHAQALRYAASQEDLQKVANAEAALEQAKTRLESLLEVCRNLPSLPDTQEDLKAAKELQEQLSSLRLEERMLPPLPPAPAEIEHATTVAQAEADYQENLRLEKSKKQNSIYLSASIVPAMGLIVAGIMMPTILLYMGLAAVLLAAGGIIFCVSRTAKISQALLALYDRHPGITPVNWVANAQHKQEEYDRYAAQHSQVLALHEDFTRRMTDLEDRIATLTAGVSLDDFRTQRAAAIASWNALSDARQDLQRTESLARTLRSMIRTAEPPQERDELSYTAPRTEELLTEARLRQRQLHTELGQSLGQAESLGSEDRIRARLDTINRRITRLEDTYYALEMAQDALREATQQLQRRFAPRISKRAQELFERVTIGRYQRLTLGEDLSLSASAQNEDTLRSAKYRSDGTIDQLYLALRLAVAEELTPGAPLILDDAFVRFDDMRLQAALDILKEAAQEKQVILFTCQSRENNMK